MFQRNKISHRVSVTCSNKNHTETYEFIEDYDDDWYEIAREKFYSDFGEYPTSIKRDVYERMD